MSSRFTPTTARTVIRCPDAGRVLRQWRTEQGFTLREVVEQSERIARALRNPCYRLSLSALADMESSGVVPDVYRMATLARIHRRPIDRVLALYLGPPRVAEG